MADWLAPVDVEDGDFFREFVSGADDDVGLHCEQLLSDGYDYFLDALHAE